jgi:serine/threonine protein phosphatase PrpC
MRLKLIAADKTDTGKQRDQNEDTPYRQIQSTEDGDRGLFIVADGMGGYQAGEVASKLAVERIRDSLHSFFAPVYEQPTIKLQVDEVGDATVKMTPEELGESTVKTDSHKGAKSQKTLKFADTPVSLSVEKQLIEAIKEANKAIIRHGEQHSGARGLGCTVTTALVQNDKAYIANVGDSRTYLLRNGELKSLTRDHSLVARLVEAKQIEPDEIYSHPQRNLIYRSLGAGHKNIDVDVFHLDLQAGDTLLLCSDGLWEMVRHEDLKKALSAPTSPQKICDNLIDMANANGGEDNITAVVVHVSTM